MTATEEQKIKAVKKLAKAYARWNVPDFNSEKAKLTRRKRDTDLYKAVNKVVKKFGLFGEYQKEIKKTFNQMHRVES